mgnify:CR=1 FL=1
MQMSTRECMVLEIDAYGYLIGRLETLDRQISHTIKRKKQREEERELKLLEYKTEDEVMEAYGYDLISRKEMELLLARFEEASGKVALPIKEEVALEELRSIVSDLYKMKYNLEEAEE